jgi:hypothetical protein
MLDFEVFKMQNYDNTRVHQSGPKDGKLAPNNLVKNRSSESTIDTSSSIKTISFDSLLK